MTSQITSRTHLPVKNRVHANDLGRGQVFMAPRTVELFVAKARGGRLQVTITVVPSVVLDARGGVYVDFRFRSRERRSVEASEAHERARGNGDHAVAALVEAESADTAGNGASGAADRHWHRSDKLVISHPMAPGRTFSVDQGETIRVEVQSPMSPSGVGDWFARGRFVSRYGDEMRSAWQII